MQDFGGILSLNSKGVSISEQRSFANYLLKDLIIDHLSEGRIFIYKEKNDGEQTNILCDRKSGNIVCINGRIDNKNDVLNKLNLIKKDLSDQEIFNEAYLKWGVEFGNYLIGSFSGVIYEARTKKLIAIKDHIGSKPLYYSIVDKKLVFATKLKPIKEYFHRNAEIDQERVKDYLIFLHGKNGKTFYKNIYKLQRSEILIIKNDKLTKRKYFFFNPSYVENFKSINDCSDAFKELFVNVIKEQSRDTEIIGTKLSGGLDSSSISSILSKETNSKIISYSAIFDNLDPVDFKKTDEKEYMDSVIQKYDLDHRFVNIDVKKVNPFNFLDDSEYNEVTPHGNRYFEILILEAASKDGIKVLFDGFDGDSVLSYGYEYLNELGSKFKLIKLIEQAKKYNPAYKFRNIIKNHVFLPYLPNDWVTYYKSKKNKDLFQKRLKIIKGSESVISEMQYNNHFNRTKIDKKNVQELHMSTLEWPIWELAMDFSYIDSKKYNIEERYPFFDRRVMEFCLSVPGKFRLKDGISRYYFRESMKQYLPEKNFNRLAKGNISPLVVNYLKENMEIIEKDIFSEFTENIIDHDYLKKNYIKPFMMGIDKESSSQLIFQLIALNKWLKKLYSELK